MKKEINTQIINEVVALIIQLIFIPTLATISYFIFKATGVGTVISTMDIPMALLTVIILVVFNVSAVLGIMYLVKRNINFKRTYSIVTGFAGILILTWIKIYYGVMTTYACSETGARLTCTDATFVNRVFMIVLICDLAYFLLFTATEYLLDYKKIRKQK